jgi:hypothetical protein
MSKIKVNGQWEDIVASKVKINGQWETVQSSWLKVNGVWQQTAAAPVGFYNDVIDYSAMFDSTSNTYLTIAPAGGANDLKKATLAFWMKRSDDVDSCPVGGWLGSTSDATRIFFLNGKFRIYHTNGGVISDFQTTAVFRDFSAWYHFCIGWDTTSGTQANRIPILEVNGLDIVNDLGGWSTSTNNLAQNDVLRIMNETASKRTRIGQEPDGTGGKFNGYIADFYGIDGTKYPASTFGEFKNGIWIPKDDPSPTYGANGFKLDFSNSSDFGEDQSGEGNNFTAVNMGADHQVTDTPEDNFCTLDFNNCNTNGVMTEGGLGYAYSGSAFVNACGTFLLKTGKWYWELDVGSDTTWPAVGVVAAGEKSGDIIADAVDLGSSVYAMECRCNGAVANAFVIRIQGGDATEDDNLEDPAADAIMQVAYDADTGKIWFGVNGTWGDFGATGIGDPANDINPAGTFSDVALYDMVPYVLVYEHITAISNFGQRTFAYTPPTGFNALCTSNLPEPTVIQPKVECTNVVLWNGNSSNPRDITGVGFDPDFVWLKNRTYTPFHQAYDSVRGANKTIYPNDNIEEQENNPNGYLSAFITDGFTVTNGASNDNNINDSSYTYAAWCLKKGAAYGFDIISYEGTGVAHAIAHNLGVVPKLIIVKQRTDDDPWRVYHYAAQNKTDPETDYGTLDTNALWADASTLWNDTAPTSTHFTVGSGNNSNGSGDDLVAYLFADIPGLIKVFALEGNGSNNGPYIHCGFRPQWIMFKNADRLASWNTRDSARDPYNAVTHVLWPDINNAELAAGSPMDFYSNGFKLKDSAWWENETHVGIAFAEQPFKYSNAR